MSPARISSIGPLSKLHQSTTGRDDQRLPDWTGVPSGAGTRSERYGLSYASCAIAHSTNFGALGNLAYVAMSCSIHNAAPVSFMSAATFARDAFA